ncbi:hypothetical protein FQN51_009020 [Onygenales sp. PD_10]|nr:hypothetical protein FQN51_009020 [Onygenales sp. PD_10]
MEKQRHDFVKGLPSDTGEYNYLGFEHLKQVLTQHEGLFVIFNGVSPEEFEKHQNHFPGRLDYNSSLKLLILNMPAFPHEEAAGEFDSLVTSKAIEMSIRDEIYFRSATRAETPDREKQADRSWSPRPNPPGRSLDWPTVVLEVAFLESREKVKRGCSPGPHHRHQTAKRQHLSHLMGTWKNADKTPSQPRTSTHPRNKDISEPDQFDRR